MHDGDAGDPAQRGLGDLITSLPAVEGEGWMQQAAP
jgi:hypothetical protein